MYKLFSAIVDAIIIYFLIHYGEYAWAGAYAAFILGMKK